MNVNMYTRYIYIYIYMLFYLLVSNFILSYHTIFYFNLLSLLHLPLSILFPLYPLILSKHAEFAAEYTQTNASIYVYGSMHFIYEWNIYLFLHLPWVNCCWSLCWTREEDEEDEEGDDITWRLSLYINVCMYLYFVSLDR